MELDGDEMTRVIWQQIKEKVFITFIFIIILLILCLFLLCTYAYCLCLNWCLTYAQTDA